MRNFSKSGLALLLVSTVSTSAFGQSGGAGDASPNATPSLNPKSSSDDAAHGGGKLKVSLALERVGGLSYTKASAKDSDTSASLTVFQLGGVTVNPYAAPRLGVDLLLESNLTLGAALSVGRYSVSASGASTTTVTGAGGTTTTTSSSSQDLGSLFIYTLTPRVGYRVAASPDFDVTPRAGLTLAGGSVSNGGSSGSAGVFALALDAEVVGAYRATQSFNLLAGVGFDYTVAASASSSSGSGSSSSSTDIKGGLFAMQLWLGVGGYL